VCWQSWVRTAGRITYCSRPVSALVANDFSATISAHSTSVSMTSLVTCSLRRPSISMDQSIDWSLCHRLILICCIRHYARNPKAPGSFSLSVFVNGSIRESQAHQAFHATSMFLAFTLYWSIVLLMCRITLSTGIRGEPRDKEKRLFLVHFR
jgi:hypothetical protein